MPSLEESQHKIDVYTNAGDWLRKSIAALKQLSENLDIAISSVESNYSINGNAPAIEDRIKTLKQRVEDIERWNREEILMHIDNEKRIGQQNYEAEQSRLEEEAARREQEQRDREQQEREQREREAQWEYERQRQEEEERRREQERQEEEARANARRIRSN